MEMALPDFRKRYTEAFRSEVMQKYLNDKVFRGQQEVTVSREEFEYLIVGVLAKVSEKEYVDSIQKLGELLDMLRFREEK